MDMALLNFFSRSSSSLPSAKDTGIEAATKEANAAVSRVLLEKQPQQSSSVPADRPKDKRKYTSFSAEQIASIGRYAAEHSNSATVKKFKSDFEQGLGESTVTAIQKVIHTIECHVGAQSLLSLAVWWAKLEKNNKVRHM